ncbi:sigma-70 family RNA polymerase sigma factor [Clostridium sp.]|uniref:sigma-70 family RNA polymerase sigma factor n=1 Tax=Clostridium sp. TaxID=1506 RepID=UPI002847093E|nr:sigma-70 family RNA polymerase sigma factor [Clostridium sp.]MDR3593803.1 sigma-70 family RNA polymerase sigma factor [Clostridium sp.]
MIDVTEHMGLASYVAWNMYLKVKNKYEFEDLLQVAYVGLIKAGNNFDESKGFKFATYAVPTIRGEVSRFLTDDKKFNISRGVSHNFLMLSYEFENENGCLQDKIGADEFEDKLINRTSLNQAINNLSDQEKKILKLYYVDEISQTEIGKMCGVFQTQIYRINKRLIKKLRIALDINVNEKVSI